MRSPGSKLRPLPSPKRPGILDNVPQPSTSKKRRHVEVDQENVERPNTAEKENDPRASKKFCVESRYTRTRSALQKKSAPKPGSSIRQTARNQPGPSRVRPSASSTITSITNTLPNNETQMDTTTSTSTSGQTQGRNQNLEEFRSKRMLKSMIESMEQELSCTICREIFVESSVLGCGHTFCGFCISKWFENASSCPICRSVQSTSPIKHNQLDNYVVKVHSLMTTEKQARREAMIQERRAEIERSRRADVRPLIVTPGRRRYIFERHSSLNPSMQSLSPPDVTNNNNQLPRTHDSLLLTPRVRVPIPAMSVNGRELTADSFANAVNILLGGNSGNIHVEFVD